MEGESDSSLSCSIITPMLGLMMSGGCWALAIEESNMMMASEVTSMVARSKVTEL